MLIKHRDFIQIYALARNASQMLESSNCSVNDSSRSFCFIQLSRGRKVRFCLCYLQKSNRYAKSLINANSFPNVMSPPYFFLAECKVGFKGRGGVGRNFLGGGGGQNSLFCIFDYNNIQAQPKPVLHAQENFDKLQEKSNLMLFHRIWATLYICIYQEVPPSPTRDKHSFHHFSGCAKRFGDGS